MSRLDNWRAFTIWCIVLAVVATLWFLWAIGLGWWLLLLACLAAIYFGSPAGGRAVADAYRRFQRSRIPDPTYYLSAISSSATDVDSIDDTDADDRVTSSSETNVFQEARPSGTLEKEGKLMAGGSASPPVASTPLPLPAQPSRPPSAKVPPSPTRSIDDLVEIQPATAAPTTVPIRPPSTPSPPTQVEFLGMGSTLELDRGTLSDSLIYLTHGTLREAGEPSCVELGLPIARLGVVPGQEPSTWPTYRSFNPSQRAFYLDWLLLHRSQLVPLSYVTLYLYGLERRVLVDAQDHDVIVQQLLRLSMSYCATFAVRRDLSCLVWLTIDLSCDAVPVSRQTFDAAFDQTLDWGPIQWRHCLATLARLNWSMSLEQALHFAAEDPGNVNSVVVTRYPELFRKIFEQRLNAEFPQGLTLPLGGRAEKIDYLILNPSLGRLPRSTTHLTARPRASADSVERDRLAGIWEQCVADVKAYDRVHRAADNGPLTAEMWEALPPIARLDEHPESDAWHALLRNAIQQLGRPLIAISDLAKIKQIEPRGRLTKKQSEQLAKTATNLFLAIEPDVRLTGKAYGWDDVVAVFPGSSSTSADLAAYQAASILLRMGMHIASADGQFDETELSRIKAHLEQQFELSPTAADRLEHLRYALLHSPSTSGPVEKSLQEKLQPEQRQVVGEFLVGIAVSDGTISAAELKALKKAWSALGLPAKSLDDLIRQPIAGGSDQDVVLDQDRISQILLDTQRVAAMLKEAMSVEEEEPDELPAVIVPVAVPPVSKLAVVAPDETPAVQTTEAAPVAWDGLAARYHAFLRSLLTQAVWQRRELDALARSQELMLGGALEAINEWTHENHGDWLTSEEGDEIHVQQGLLT